MCPYCTGGQSWYEVHFSGLCECVCICKMVVQYGYAGRSFGVFRLGGLGFADYSFCADVHADRHCDPKDAHFAVREPFFLVSFELVQVVRAQWTLKDRIRSLGFWPYEQQIWWWKAWNINKCLVASGMHQIWYRYIGDKFIGTRRLWNLKLPYDFKARVCVYLFC